MTKFKISDNLSEIEAIFDLLKHLGRKEIISNSSIYIGGNFLQKIFAIVLIPILTRYFTPDEFGIYGLILIIESILVIIFGLGIQSSVVRYYYDYCEQKESLKQFISTNYFFLLLIVLLLIVFQKYLGPGIWELVSSGRIPYFPYILILVITASTTILINFANVIYQSQQNARDFVISQTALLILNLLFTIYFVIVINSGLIGLLIGRLISTSIMAFILTIILLKNWFSIHFTFEAIKKSLIFGFPLVFHSLFSWALGSIDRLMLEPHVSLSELGFYNLGYQIGGVLTAILISINQAWVPYYNSILKKEITHARIKIQQISTIYVILFGYFCLIGMLFSKEIIQIISAPQYIDASLYVPITLFSALFNGYYFMVSTPIFYQKKTMWIPIMTGSTAFLNIGLNLLWIPQFGALGSAWATLVSYFVLACIAYLLGQSLFKINLPIKRILALNSILAFSMYLLTYSNIQSPGLYLLKAFLFIIYSLFVYWGFIKRGLFSDFKYNYGNK